MKLATLFGGLGTMGLLAIGWGGGLLLCSIAELILTVQRVDLRGTLFVGEGFYALGCHFGSLCWAVLCFWFGLGNPRPSQECPNIFYQSLKIYNSVQMGAPLWLALLRTQISKNIGYSKLTLMGVVEFCK